MRRGGPHGLCVVAGACRVIVMGNGLSAEEFRDKHQREWAPICKARLLAWEAAGFPVGSKGSDDIGAIIHALLKGCCDHANVMNAKRVEKGEEACVTVEFGERDADGRWQCDIKRFRLLGGAWLMTLLRRQGFRCWVCEMMFSSECEMSIERKNQFETQPPSYTHQDCVVIFTLFQHDKMQWTPELFQKLIAARVAIDMVEQRRQSNLLYACHRAREGHNDQPVELKMPPSSVFVTYSRKVDAERALAEWAGDEWASASLFWRLRVANSDARAGGTVASTT